MRMSFSARLKNHQKIVTSFLLTCPFFQILKCLRLRGFVHSNPLTVPVSLPFLSTRISSSNSIETLQPVNKNPHFTPIAAMASSKTKKKKTVQPKKRKQCLKEEEGAEKVPDIEDIFSDKETHQIRASLLDWYDRNHRDLPWRRLQTSPFEEDEENEEEERKKRAYGVWVSEVMLQQTRVQTVIDYYNRWMLKWPTLHHLAQASIEEVNEMWAGLGYYRRARFLLEGAKMIIAGSDGFPSTVSSLRKVPGIGDYTAGAIASIAFKEVVPVVDGNVIRVLARLRTISANPKDTKTVKSFWRLAAQLVDPSRPGDLNQSLMELGATICSPLNPNCSSCPVSGQCRALSISKQDESVLVTDYPTKVVKVKQRHDFSAVCVVEISRSQYGVEGDQSGNEFLLVRRPDEGLLAGLWEFPTVMFDKEADLTTRRKEIDCFLKKSFRLDPQRTCSIVQREEIGEFIHIFTHIRLKVYVELLVVHLKGGMNDLFSKQHKGTMAWKFVDNKALSNLGLTSAVRKVVNMVQKFKQNSLLTDSGPARKNINSKKQRSS